MKELLADNGSIYLHCDSTMSHYLKLLMDEVFGIGHFQNEIVWAYRTGGVGKTSWPRKHDVLLFYSKSNGYMHKPLQERIYYEKPFFNEQVDDEGRYFADVYIRDTWDDIKPVINVSKERIDYPTQKPEALLERIIKASSNPGNLVFDCFMGSGTTQAVAMKLGRRFIGADINLGAVETTTKRLHHLEKEIREDSGLYQMLSGEEGQQQPLYTGFDIYNVNHYDIVRNPVEATALLIKALEIQPLPSSSIYDGEKDGRMVKIMPINRIATRADLTELINGFDYRAFQKRQEEHPTRPVEKLLLVCMGHEPDLAAALQNEVAFDLDIEVIDILQDKSNLEFKRESQAKIVRSNRKLSPMKENVKDPKELDEKDTQQMQYVFVSYVRENEKTVNRLYHALTSQGVHVWLDREKIKPGDQDDTYMNEELTVAIDVLRQKSLDRPWFIPVKLNECKIPDRDIGGGRTFEDFQWVELHEEWDIGIQKLLKSILPENPEVESPFKISNTKAKHGDHERTISNEEVVNIPERKPTAIVRFEIDGIPNEQVVFTRADAAFNSEQFSEALSWMEEYNAKYRGKRVKGGLSGDFQNSFPFLTESAAIDFAKRATKDYNNTIREKYNYIDIREKYPWYIVQLYPRYFGS